MLHETYMIIPELLVNHYLTHNKYADNKEMDDYVPHMKGQSVYEYVITDTIEYRVLYQKTISKAVCRPKKGSTCYQ